MTTLICLIHPSTVVSSTCSTAPRLLGAAAASANTSIDGKLKIILPYKKQIRKNAETDSKFFSFRSSLQVP